ncbi:MAG: spore coat associated protein CotJA [Bacillota bacterium]
MRLARAYIPFQRYGQVWSPAEGLRRGTIFPELFSPYIPRDKGSCGTCQ